MPAYLSDFSIPGGAVALIENGHVILARGFGMADAAAGTPVSERTLFNIGSTSKSISAWGAMRLVSEGKLELDAPVEARLTRWHLPPSSYDTAGVTLKPAMSCTCRPSRWPIPCGKNTLVRPLAAASSADTVITSKSRSTLPMRLCASR